ncbi:hypothetical protein OO17_09590 [Rhodopseudomonas palustris]|uniref:Uncharacterized protein n=2 Tax=Nitrobacteraceae TaxID=41294 RepID=A0A0D7EV71_RHOPL|nr:hypothetical protein OO17_09590 [Rhodopseudomonas palustris]
MGTKELRFALNLEGPFQFSTSDGDRIEIPSKKGVALVAMLAMSKEGERTRGWLQDRLWRNRGPAEAAGSLRRELSNLRKCLNAGAEPLLICERDRVRLRLDLIDVDALNRTQDTGRSDEFLEGFDIPGENGFRGWLCEQRLALARAPQLAPSPADVSRAAPRALGPLPSYIVDTSQPVLGFEGNHAIAVLPFGNLTGDEEHDYLAEGISEELIGGLSRIRWLPVIARNSSFSFADSVDRKFVGQRLGAKYLLEGHLYRAHDSYGISASLSESVTGYAIWSRRFPLASPTSREALEQFVNELVAHLGTRIEHAEQTRTRAKRQDSLGVNDLIWRGRWHMNRLTRADSEMAQKLFAEALALDPESPEALIQATAALGWAIWAGRQPQEQILRMRKLAQQATLADPDDGRGFMLAGIAEMWLRHPLQAKVLLQQAIALNPSLMLAHAQLGGSYNLIGEAEPAIAHLKAALRLSSNDPHMFYSLGELAMAYTLLSRWDDAIEHADHALARRPAYWYAHVIKINAVARSGNIAAARLAFDELVAAKPNFSKQYIDWLPFFDRGWIDHLVEGLRMASGRRSDWLTGQESSTPYLQT